jgi:hypothetical protein
VRLSAGAYTTSAWLDKTASSTESAQTAALNLVKKIDGIKNFSVSSKVRFTNVNGHLVEHFEIWGKLPKAVRQ